MKKNGSRILLPVRTTFLDDLIMSMRKRTQGKKGLPELTVSGAAVYHVQGQRQVWSHCVCSQKQSKNSLNFLHSFMLFFFSPLIGY